MPAKPCDVARWCMPMRGSMNLKGCIKDRGSATTMATTTPARGILDLISTNSGSEISSVLQWNQEIGKGENPVNSIILPNC